MNCNHLSRYLIKLREPSSYAFLSPSTLKSLLAITLVAASLTTFGCLQLPHPPWSSLYRPPHFLHHHPPSVLFLYLFCPQGLHFHLLPSKGRPSSHLGPCHLWLWHCFSIQYILISIYIECSELASACKVFDWIFVRDAPFSRNPRSEISYKSTIASYNAT